MTRHLIITILLSIACVAPLSAQEAVAKAVAQLEKNPLTTIRMYREKRDPATHKIIEQSKMIEFNQITDRKRLIDAFKKDKDNAVEYSVYNNHPNEAYTIVFNDNKGTLTRYMLSQTKDHWTLIVKTEPTHEPRHKSTRKNLSFIPDFDVLPYSILSDFAECLDTITVQSLRD